MARKPALPPLSAPQVVALFDELLSNADRLLSSALNLLDDGSVGLARSLAILGLEESGKAIAIHERRRQMAYEPEGALFVDARLEKLWADHKLKLDTAYKFLVAEEYWFDTEPPAPDANRVLLGEIEVWSKEHNVLKQRGFYVDIDPNSTLLTPGSDTDEESLRQVINHIHQIGWQLRLGEHIVAKAQEQSVQAIPPATAEEIARMRRVLTNTGTEQSKITEICDAMGQGRAATTLNNDAFRHRLPPPGSNPFATLGMRGYEAQTRELYRLAEDIGLNPSEDAGDR